MAEMLSRKPQTFQENSDWNTYIRLAREEKSLSRQGRTLAAAKRIQLKRVRLRLLTSGVIRTITQDKLHAIARDAYLKMSWRARVMMHVAYRWQRLKGALMRFRASRELKKLAKG